MYKKLLLTSSALLTVLISFVFVSAVNIPKITSFSPTAVQPGETVVTIKGSGFGDKVNTTRSEVCFGLSQCYPVYDLQDELKAWSDTEIKILVPKNIKNKTDKIGVRAYLSVLKDYDYITSPEKYTTISSAPTCTKDIWSCGGWGECSSWQKIESRKCTMTFDCPGISTTRPPTTQACIPKCTKDSWSCGGWGTCINNKQTRSCKIYKDCPYVSTPSPVTFQSCKSVPKTPKITSFSPTAVQPGETVVTIKGSGFGDKVNTTRSEVCFGLSQCYPVYDLQDELKAWSDTEIKILVPKDIKNKTDKIGVRAYLSVLKDYDYITSPEKYTTISSAPTCTKDVWSCGGWGECSTKGTKSRTCKLTKDCKGVYTPKPTTSLKCAPVPEITSFTPTKDIIPGKTVITVTGKYFGNNFIVGKNNICFGIKNGCISRKYINKYLKKWSDTKIQILMPDFVSKDDKLGLIVRRPGTSKYNFIYPKKTFKIKLQPDPKITSISPTRLIPGQTVTIIGKGFGEEYKPKFNQVCFNASCIQDKSRATYIKSWSDTKIVLKVPSFVISEGKINLKLYTPSKGHYSFVQGPSYTTERKPLVTWYYRKMDQGGKYYIKGKYFGDSRGKIFIDGTEVPILKWNDVKVEFKIPSNATGNTLYIQNAKGLKSRELSVKINAVTIYSNDPHSKYQWQWKPLNIKKAWGITEGSGDIVVAVIDTGVDTKHEDLKHAIWRNKKEIAGNKKDDDKNGYIDDVNGWDFVLNSNSVKPRRSHGTLVAGMIAAKKDNGVGIAGIAPNVKIMPLNVAKKDANKISVNAAIKAIKYAVDNGADIINLSFGGRSSSFFYRDILQYAYDNNVLVIAAAGNDNDNLDVRSRSPICVDLTNNAVIGVASTLEGNKKTSFSNYGKKCIDVSAPGQYLPVTVPNGYGRGKGTSFSAPLVAGIAALIKSKNPTWNIEEIKHAILNSAVSVDNVNSKYVGKLGKGIPDVYTALTAAKPKASYTYKPRKQVKIEKTKVEIEIKEPEVQPIKKPEPIKNERIEKHKATKDPTPIKSEKSTPIQNEQKKTNTSKHTITPLFPDIGKHEYIKSINYLKQNRIVKGYPDGTFKPNKVINRAEFTKIIMNGFEKDVGGSNCFPDVKKQWFAGFVCSAKKLGIIKGYPNGKFHPEKTINIVEALKIVLETSGVKLKAQPGKAWYMPYVNYAAGTDLRFILNKKRFEENVTRGEMAKMIYVLKVM